MHSHGQVGHDAQRHPGSDGLGLGGRKLIVELPLQPAVEVDRAVMACGERADLRTVGVLQTRRPRSPVIAVLLGERAPGGEVIECVALAVSESLERLLAPS